ncbi:Glycine zipper 2TM domain [Comamonas aquatica]|uniref:glycine zipper domain-containing protein n=1 Tax=Comamonas aquatica TaxID=225991 RepID=UPI001F9664A8|nr:Glycine zipper 2TM domain [Comamonas aquatica]
MQQPHTWLRPGTDHHPGPGWLRQQPATGHRRGGRGRGLVGDAVLGGTIGTLGGAAAGAVIGNQIGKNQDQK